MKKLLLLTFLMIGHASFAQKFTLKGRVLDNTDAALPSATVLLLQPKDSSLVSFGATDTQGVFELKNVSSAEYLFKISFLGFDTYFKKIAPPTGSDMVDLGTIKLKPASNELKEVLVEGEKSPVVIKKDTIEYNAGSFKTQPNAAAEELLKKLPGVEMDAEGNFTVKGEKVQRVTVDGKEFFGKDPKMATKNLPADAIDKVQVFDKKSDQAMFSGIDDGKREKTINLQLKEEKRNSAFGNVMAGVGTNERYQAKGSLNRFSKGKQLSFLGMANNVNSQGFGFDEYMNFSGGGATQMGGGRIMITTNNTNGVPLNFGGRMNGMMDTQAAGLNFNNQFTKKTEANGSYFFNNLDQNISRDVTRETFSPRGSFLSDENTHQETSNLNHRGNFSLDQKIDSLNSLKLTANFGYTETVQNERGQSQTFSPEGLLQNKGIRNAIATGNVFNLNSNLLYRHRFGKPGRYFSANTQFSLNQNDSKGQLDAVNEFLNRPSNILKQESEQDNNAQTYGLTLSYTEPLGNRMYLETNYSFRQDLNQVDREVFDLGSEQRELNMALSNKYNSDFLYHKAGLNYKVNREKYNLTVGSSLQQSRLEGEMLLLDTDVKRSFQNVLPTAQFNYDFANNRRMNFNYETNVQEPTIRQLQPIVDNSNPLNLYVGNENLRPAYMHNWRLNYSSFDAGTLMSFFGMITVNYTTNAITNAQSFDENFVRTTQPVNVDDNTMVSAFGNFSFPIKKYNSRFTLGTNLREQHTVNVQNDVENDINIRSATGNIRYSYRLKEDFEFSLRADLTAQRTKYEQAEISNQLFFNKTYAGEVNYRFLKTFNFNTTFDYLVYNNPDSDFNQSIPLWNMSISKQFLKNNTGELKLAAINLLDRSMGVNQTANSLYVERETLNSLGQYFMLSFTYTINKHLNPMEARSGGMRIFR